MPAVSSVMTAETSRNAKTVLSASATTRLFREKLSDFAISAKHNTTYPRPALSAIAKR